MIWEAIHKLDQQITLVINSWNSDFTDSVMVFLSDKFVWIPMYLLIIGLLFWRLKWKKALAAIVAIGLTFLLCEQISNLVKDCVCRIRPLNDQFMVLHGLNILERGGGYSFFSAHAANTFGLATCSSLLLLKDRGYITKCYTAWIFIWAFLVSASRIFVGRHFLGDVVVGIAVGALIGWLVGHYGRLLSERYIR